MKLNFTRILILLSALALFYTACTKNALKPAPAPTTNYAALSSRIAENFYKSITGEYGGTDVTKGIASPFSIKTNRRTLLSDPSSPLCGFVIDTTYNYITHSGTGAITASDTINTFYQAYHFVYTCTAGVVNGYTVADSVRTTQQFTYTFNNTSAVGQHYTVAALDSTFQLVSMNGTLNSTVIALGLNDESGAGIIGAYTLNGLVVNFSSGTADVTSGTSTFYIQTYSTTFPAQPVTTNYSGTIQFLGNYEALLTINPGYVYKVNLTTGVATPAS